jgi:hypothetical protein
VTWLLALLAAALAFWVLRALGWRRGWSLLASLVVLLAIGRIKRGDGHR